VPPRIERVVILGKGPLGPFFFLPVSGSLLAKEREAPMARATTTTRRKTTTAAKSTAAKTAAPKTTTARKSATRKAAPKPVAAKAPVKKGVTAAAAGGATVTRELKKKELVDRVAQASGLKKPQAKAAIEAMLDVLGETIAKGEAMNLEPLGKVKVQNQKDAGAAVVYACRVRRKKAAAVGAKAPLAAAAE